MYTGEGFEPVGESCRDEHAVEHDAGMDGHAISRGENLHVTYSNFGCRYGSAHAYSYAFVYTFDYAFAYAYACSGGYGNGYDHGYGNGYDHGYSLDMATIVVAVDMDTVFGLQLQLRLSLWLRLLIRYRTLWLRLLIRFCYSYSTVRLTIMLR